MWCKSNAEFERMQANGSHHEDFWVYYFSSCPQRIRLIFTWYAVLCFE